MNTEELLGIALGEEPGVDKVEDNRGLTMVPMSGTDTIKVKQQDQAAPTAARAQDRAVNEFALAVARGLSDTPRRLDCRYLYDARGSELFERICEQPEYYPTRTEAAILTAAAADIADQTGEVTIIELGSGSSIKTQIILEAYAERHGAVCYTPVDISKSILEQAEQEITAKYPSVRVDALHGTYDQAFPLFSNLSPSMLLFLGSTLGNLDALESSQFWERVSSHLLPGDFCLLGVDITQEHDALHAAYNDAAGYSAAFTKNIFERMNRELGAGIDTTAIEHMARYNPAWQRVEIFAQFNQPQKIELAPLGKSYTINAGETVLTEISRKFQLRQLVPYLQTFGLRAKQVYTDYERRMALLLLQNSV